MVGRDRAKRDKPGIAYSNTNNIAIFLRYGNISFASELILSTDLSFSPYSIASGDFNNDAYPDIVIGSYGSNADDVGIFLGYDNGSFRQSSKVFH